jgi:hypothetical protein
MFCNFYLVKNHKFAKNSTTTEGRYKICTDLENLEFSDVCLTRFKNNQILLNKVIHRFLLTAKLCTGWKSLIRGNRGQLLEGTQSKKFWVTKLMEIVIFS